MNSEYKERDNTASACFMSEISNSNCNNKNKRKFNDNGDESSSSLVAKSPILRYKFLSIKEFKRLTNIAPKSETKKRMKPASVYIIPCFKHHILYGRKNKYGRWYKIDPFSKSPCAINYSKLTVNKTTSTGILPSTSLPSSSSSSLSLIHI